MKMPFVASAACWRKTVELEPLVGVDDDDGKEGSEGDGFGFGSGSWRISMGMESRWHAKMAFMMGMY